LKDRKFDAKDDFWAIEMLVPKVQKPRNLPRPIRRDPDVSAVEIISDAPERPTGESKLTLSTDLMKSSVNVPEVPQKPVLEYIPVSPLIGKVKIYKWKNSYNYYEDFKKDAIRYKNASALPCNHAAFFSYVPQYVQLNEAQLSWYLYFRDCVRNGSYPKCDYSYILLLIYEIINLGELADVREGQKLLCDIHKNYRKAYPKLDRILGEWVCDYSILHRLPPPTNAHPALSDASSLKEFYAYFEGVGAADSYAKLLIRSCSAYDYKKSKFAVGDALPIYDKHIVGALASVLIPAKDGRKLITGSKLENNFITRDAYSGALCAADTKRRMEIEFCSFSSSHELRFIIADIVKYSENKIRAHIGVKSRLSVFGLTKEITSALDAYFARELPIIRHTHAEKERPVEEYDKLYEPPKTELSLKNAELIEKSSWETTAMLEEAFEEESPSEPEPKAHHVAESLPVISAENTDEVSHLKEILKEKYEFIEAAIGENFTLQKEIAKKLSMMSDALADTINDAAADVLGDIILEDCGDGYTIIEDYREIFEK